MTHPLSKYWDQPDTSRIILTPTHALISRTDWAELKEYSGTYPTGVYEGKTWKRHDGAFDPEFCAAGGEPEWKLVWYGTSEDPDKVSINFRDVHIIETLEEIEVEL